MPEKFPEKEPLKIEKVGKFGDLSGKEIRYRQDSINRATSWGDDTEGRGRMEYEEDFKVKPEDLLGKHVLNMGAGPSVKYEREVLQAIGTDSNTEFFSVSPDFAEDKHRAIVLDAISKEPEDIRKHIHLLAGIGQIAALKDASIDTAFLFHVLEHTNQVEILFREMSRVLKPNGRIYAGPILERKEFIPTVEQENALRYTQTNVRQLRQKDYGEVYYVDLLYGYFEKAGKQKD